MRSLKLHIKNNFIIFLLLGSTILFFLAFLITFSHAGYSKKLLIKLGLAEETTQMNDAALSWNNCLEKLNYDADIVFFGDSITRNSDFRKFFPDKNICNLGCGGDSILNLIDRIDMVKSVSPEKVFVMGGINSLASRTLGQSTQDYDHLLDALIYTVPDAEIYVLSVLPVSYDSTYCSNPVIQNFNTSIEASAKSRNLTYVDLYSLYSLNGSLPAKYTDDGLHLKANAYSLWADAIEKYIN